MRESKAQILEPLNPNEIVFSKIVGNNTVEYVRSTGERVIRLHQTDIVTFLPDEKTITLNSGGWKTPTTKERMNRFLPNLLRIYSDHGQWYIGEDGRSESPPVPFFDGIQIKDGKLPKPKPKLVKDQTDLIKKINKFCREIKNLDILPKPNNGDCWYCLMFDGQETGKKTKSTNTSHLVSHMHESYIPGALLVNAMRWAGYDDGSISLHYQMRLNDTFVRAVRRYLKFQLGL